MSSSLPRAALVAFALTGLIGAGSALAGSSPDALAQVQKAHFVDSDGVAIHGYDPVSYFKGQGAPGSRQFASRYEGATYLFASAENKALFDKSPAAYAPQYGGYCALGAAYGGKFRTDPSTGRVVQGKLYFNKNKSVSAEWSKDIAGYIQKADVKWPAVQQRDIDGG